MIALAVQDQSQVSETRRRATEMAQRQGFGDVDAGRVALVATELATNILKHGNGGEILVGTYGEGSSSGVELIALDRGPGIANLAASMADGYSTSGTSGKGLGAALLTTMLQGALSGMTLGTDPVRVFNHINRFLCEHAEVGRYATMFFGILDRSGKLQFINAGHPSPLILRQGEVSELIQEGSFPIGLIPEAEFVAAEARLEPGDTLALFSDGVTEAMDTNEQLFGVSRLTDVLSGQHDTPLDQLQKKVLKSIEGFTRGASQADDITLLLVRYRTVESG